MKAELIKEISKINKEQTDSINVSIDKVEQELKVKIKEDFDKQIKVSDLSNKIYEKEIQMFKKEMDTEMKKMKVDIRKNEGDIWKINGVGSNALSSYLETSFLSLDLNRNMTYILDDVVSILEARNEIHQYDYNALNKLIDRLSDKYIEHKNKITLLYKDKPVYKYTNHFGESEKEYIKDHK